MERFVWWLMVKIVRVWGERYLDQFDMFKFQGSHGTVYVNIGRSTPYPDAFGPVNANGRPVLALLQAAGS